MPNEITPPPVDDEEICLYVFVVPSEEPLGVKDGDFSNVQVKSSRVSDGEISDIDRSKVLITCTGRLGTLPRGLLHTADIRKKMTREKVVQTFVENVSCKLQKKRRGIGYVGVPLLFFCLNFEQQQLWATNLYLIHWPGSKQSPSTRNASRKESRQI